LGGSALTFYLVLAKKGPVAQEGVTSVVGGTTEQLPADLVPPQTSTQALTEAGKEFYATWYPTLEHTLKLLFKLYYTVDVSIYTTQNWDLAPKIDSVRIRRLKQLADPKLFIQNGIEMTISSMVENS
jgi:hypothetical protein